MSEEELREQIARIEPLNEEATAAARKRQAILAKPPGSLGQLEEISVRLAGITGKVCNRVEARRILVFCADNGVVAEQVSCTPQSVTAVQAVQMTKRMTGMSCMAKAFGDDVQVIDVGIATPYSCAEIFDRKIALGTKNLALEPAMTREQAVRAILIGISFARTAKEDGIRLLGVGEMGIGNTTTSAAVLAALTGTDAEAVTGRGGGLTDAAFRKKIEIVRSALRREKPDPHDPIDVLTKVGGFDLAAMCGAFLGAALYRLPIVIDGFISVVAALCAARLCPKAAEFFFPSHASFEQGYQLAIDALGLQPWLLLGMRLGEGSGCPLAFRIIEAACTVMNDMETFDDAKIDDGYLDEIRKGDHFSV